MMGRLRAMREPLKYVQGRDALYKFHEEMGYMGKKMALCLLQQRLQSLPRKDRKEL